MGYIDVGDGCWRPNVGDEMLKTKCWWPNVGDDVGDGFNTLIKSPT